VIAPVLDVVVIAVLGELQPGYSHVRQFISELGEPGRPFAAVANVWFVLVSALFAGFTLALLQGIPASRASTIGSVCFGVWTATGIIGGFFPCDAGCAGATWPGFIHNLLGEIGTLCILPVPTLIWLGLRRDPNWTGYGWFTLAIQLLALTTLVLLAAAWFGLFPLNRILEPSLGLLQRLSLGTYYIWTAVIGLKVAGSRIEKTNDLAQGDPPQSLRSKA